MTNDKFEKSKNVSELKVTRGLVVKLYVISMIENYSRGNHRGWKATRPRPAWRWWCLSWSWPAWD